MDDQPADYVNAEDLGLTDAEVRERYPWATELTGLDGRPCWDRRELEEGTDT